MQEITQKKQIRPEWSIGKRLRSDLNQTAPPMINSHSFDNYREPFKPQIPINIDVQPMHIYEPPVYIPPPVIIDP